MKNFKFYFIYAIVLAVCLLTIAIQSIPLQEVSDSLSLFNPVYMYSTYNKMVYPVHGFFDNMPVHPPSFYYIQGLIYKLFDSKYLAYKLPVIILAVFYFLSILLSHISRNEKILWVSTLSLVSILFNNSINQRPEFFLLMTFVIGLFYLELFRKKRNLYFLFIGAVFLSLTSTMHYFASFSFIGIIFYITPLIKKQNKSSKLFYALFPIVIIVGGYLLCQVIPNFWDIWNQIKGVKADGNSIQNHEATIFGFPIVVISGILIFFFRRDFISLYLASFPVTYFVFLFSSGKSGGYYLIEFFIFILVITTILFDFLNGKEGVKKYFKIAYVIIIFFISSTFYIVSSSFLNNEDAQLYRKAAIVLHGQNKSIVSRMDLWYISGTKHYLNLNPILIWNYSKIKPQDKTFAKQFDLIAEHKHMSNNTTNQFKTTISGLYLEKSITLNSYIYNQSELKDANIVYYSSLPNKVFRALINCDSDSYCLFKEVEYNAEYYFVSIVTQSNYQFLEKKLNYFTAMALVDKDGQEYQLDKDVKQFLCFGIIEVDRISEIFTDSETLKLIDKIPIGKPEYILKDDIRKSSSKKVLIYKDLEALKSKSPYY